VSNKCVAIKDFWSGAVGDISIIMISHKGI